MNPFLSRAVVAIDSIVIIIDGVLWRCAKRKS